MKLKLIRDTFTDNSTIGKLYVNDIYECNTLEDVVRKGVKVHGKTAIPEGYYPVIIDFSPKYKVFMPHVMNVPNYSGIRIHSGNQSEDTEGCILVGLGRKTDWISQSKLAYQRLFAKMEEAADRGQHINIEITSERT